MEPDNKFTSAKFIWSQLCHLNGFYINTTFLHFQGLVILEKVGRQLCSPFFLRVILSRTFVKARDLSSS